MEWIDYQTGKAYYQLPESQYDRSPLELEHDKDSYVELNTLARVYQSYREHPEPTCLGPDGQVRNDLTRGMLAHRPVCAGRVHVHGKESSELEEGEPGETESVEYASFGLGEREQRAILVAEVEDQLRQTQEAIGYRSLARALEVTPATIRTWLSKGLGRRDTGMLIMLRERLEAVDLKH